MFFLIVSLGLVAVIYGYCGWRLLLPCRLHGSAGVAAWLSLAAVALLPHLYILVIRPAPSVPEWLRDGLAWVAYVGLGFAIITFSLLLVRDLGWVLWLALGKLWALWASDREAVAAVDPERRQHLLQLLNLGVIGLAFVATGHGVFVARRKPPVVVLTVPITDLPPALEGFRIAQITDIHVGPTIKGDFVQSVVDIVNSLDVDLIAFTGDLADGSVPRLRAHVAPLRDLKATHGTFFVTGNHEYYSGVEDWVREVRRLGMDVLLNEHRVVRHGDALLAIGGVTDHGAAQMVPQLPEHDSSAAAAFDGAPAEAVRLLLAHQPRSALDAVQTGFDLLLSGHTHGGQLLPWRCIVMLQQPYISGLHAIETRLRNGATSWVYVSSGTGYWGPPVRFQVPSEITHITLTRA